MHPRYPRRLPISPVSSASSAPSDPLGTLLLPRYPRLLILIDIDIAITVTMLRLASGTRSLFWYYILSFGMALCVSCGENEELKGNYHKCASSATRWKTTRRTAGTATRCLCKLDQNESGSGVRAGGLVWAGKKKKER